VKEELVGLAFAEALAEVFRETLGSSLREFVAGVGTQAEAASVGRTLCGKSQKRMARTGGKIVTEWTP